MPPIAAMLNWTDSLKSRIEEPLEKFEKNKRIVEKEEFKEIKSSYTSIYNMNMEEKVKKNGIIEPKLIQ